MTTFPPAVPPTEQTPFWPTSPPQLLPSLKEAIEIAYGADRAASIQQQLLQRVAQAQAQRPPALQQLDQQRPADWYKDEVVYMFYVDRFGVPAGQDKATLDDLPATLDYLQDLGVTTLYLLPFLDSPMGDAGFDVRDLMAVRQDLGGLDAFRRFMAQVKARGFKLKADLILNHLSDQHSWFQAALAGDRERLDYFIHKDQMPPYTRYRDEQRGIVVDYTEPDGQISSRRLIFPDNTDTHWRKVMVHDQARYVYHTFYPFQVDLNWDNPAVLFDVLSVLTFWANEGVDIFRLDAIPYFIKEAGTDGENQPRTHAIIQILSLFVQMTAPASVIQVEACQWPQDILPYFGQTQWTDVATSPSQHRTTEAQIAYHFPFMPGLWATLLTGQPHHVWQALAATPSIPPSASWATFLRVHDELTLEMVDLATRELLYSQLEPLGQPFRKGLGVSGRLADFLGQDDRRILQAFRLLLTLPGLPILYYGDELAQVSDPAYAQRAALEREAIQRALNPAIDVVSFYDSRDINRGPLSLEALQQVRQASAAQYPVYYGVRQALHWRQNQVALRRGSLEPIHTPTAHIMAYLRQTGPAGLTGQDWLLLHNLQGQAVTVELPLLQKSGKLQLAQPREDGLGQGPQAISVIEPMAIVDMAPYQSLALAIDVEIITP